MSSLSVSEGKEKWILASAASPDFYKENGIFTVLFLIFSACGAQRGGTLRGGVTYGVSGEKGGGDLFRGVTYSIFVCNRRVRVRWVGAGSAGYRRVPKFLRLSDFPI